MIEHWDPDLDEWVDVGHRVAPVPHDVVLEIALTLAFRVPGHIVEFGVYRGRSTRVLRRVLRGLQRGQMFGPKKEIFACDSFRGLPEKFENLEVGALASDVPRMRGVHIVEGYFEDSLTPALARRVGRVALASLDADLHSSTLCALRWLTPLLDTGSLLLFDEYLGENAGERRAHDDWLRETGLRTVCLAEFLREPSGQVGDPGHGSTPDRRVLFQVVGPAALTANEVFGIADVRRLGRRVAKRVVRAAGRATTRVRALTPGGR